MSDIRVPVKFWLNGPDYRRALAVARSRHFDSVGELLHQIIRAELTFTSRRRYHRISPELWAELDRLVGDGLSINAAALKLGITPAAAYQRHRRRQDKETQP